MAGRTRTDLRRAQQESPALLQQQRRTSACFSNAASRRSPTVSACWQPMAVWCACAPPRPAVARHLRQRLRADPRGLPRATAMSPCRSATAGCACSTTMYSGHALAAGRRVEHIEAPFQPEHGAYGGGHHHSHAGEAGSATHRACTSSAYARERDGRARPGLGSAPAGQPAAADRRLQLFRGWRWR